MKKIFLILVILLTTFICWTQTITLTNSIVVEYNINLSVETTNLIPTVSSLSPAYINNTNFISVSNYVWSQIYTNGINKTNLLSVKVPVIYTPKPYSEIISPIPIVWNNKNFCWLKDAIVRVKPGSSFYAICQVQDKLPNDSVSNWMTCRVIQIP
jgi:hypothetical protein